MSKNLFRKFKKRSKDRSVTCRPEDENHREKVFQALKEAQQKGDITPNQYVKLFQRTKARLTESKISSIVEQFGAVGGILGAVATAVGVVLDELSSDSEDNDSNADEEEPPSTRNANECDNDQDDSGNFDDG